MKRLLLTITILTLISLNISAATITATSSGSWTNNATWDLGRQPADGDLIIIPSGITVTVPDFTTIDLKGPGVTVIRVAGTLTLGFFSAIDINNGDGDRIEILTGGTLNTSFIGLFFFDGVPLLAIDFTNPVTGPAVIQDGTLPIELASFEANLEGNIVKISWTTAAEINNDFFTIERSVDGREWEVIGEVPGAGNSNTSLDYTFTDYDPVPGMLYYRLKQTDFDGQFEYFDPAVVLYQPENLFKVFPNPVVSKLRLTTTSDLTNATIRVRNMNGSREEVAMLTTDHQAEIDVAALPEGIYVLEIVFPQSILSKRFAKH